MPLSFSSSLLPKKVASTFWNTGIPHIIHESTKNSVFSKLQLPLVCLLTWTFCNQFQFFREIILVGSSPVVGEDFLFNSLEPLRLTFIKTTSIKSESSRECVTHVTKILVQSQTSFLSPPKKLLLLLPPVVVLPEVRGGGEGGGQVCVCVSC